MTKEFYLSRHLYDNDRTYSEAELLAASKFIIVLAEPGGGKTELLDSLANQLGATRQTATKFRYQSNPRIGDALILDAFDEVARVDPSGISEILGKALDTDAKQIVVASRSSEWEGASTHRVEEFFGSAPTVARMVDFTEHEQKEIFDRHLPGEDFEQFRAEIRRFDLEPLLPNPQLLKLFADAYTQSERHFAEKSSIFELAVERMAQEANKSVSQKGQHPPAKKIEIANEVFAKLLLSGSEGVSTSETAPDRLYPLLASLVAARDRSESILQTKLFKPGDEPDQHLPVHKIVAEYCGAKYLTDRIGKPENGLSLQQCMAIIAPNGTSRDELRGLLGWVAALGNKPTQEIAIDLDPYAILANGDPSRLLPSSKRKLIQKLQELAQADPFFRRSDIWRTFSASGFFSPDVVDHLRPLLEGDEEHGHLRGLLLELLIGSAAIPLLANELQLLLLNQAADNHTRSLAHQCLLEVPAHDHVADLTQLIAEKSNTSLRIAASIIRNVGRDEFEKALILDLLNACATLYPAHNERLSRTIGSRHFVKRFIGDLDLPLVRWLLDDLTRDLKCSCGEKHYECDCRNGISKIVGSLLDRYFELSNGPFDPATIWKWISNLNFHRETAAKDCTSVRALREDDELRQGIIALALGHETDPKRIRNVLIEKFWGQSHAGISLRSQDYRFLVDLAFNTGNVSLWLEFAPSHSFYRQPADRGPDDLRRHARDQTRQNDAFLAAWAKREQAIRHSRRNEDRSLRFRRSRAMKKRDNKLSEIRAANLNYTSENRALIASGRHWGCLLRFAELVLMKPDKIEDEFGDTELVSMALRNCLEFIEPDVPSLQELAELQCASQYRQVETVLHAACLEIWREKGTLHEVKLPLLAALRTHVDIHYDRVSEDERAALKAEADRLLFPTAKQAEKFVREYIEPQLAIPGCKHAQVSWLEYDDTFKPFLPTLPIEWLERFPDLPIQTTDELFEMAAQHENRQRLEEIIAKRSEDLLRRSAVAKPSDEDKHWMLFWFVRAFYFLPSFPHPSWKWLKTERDTVLSMEGRSGRLSRSDRPSWPRLSAEKIEALLTEFIDQWPKVELPGIYGTDSPKEEKAYRFLSDAVWLLGQDDAADSIPVIDRLLLDHRLNEFEPMLRSIRATATRKLALSEYQPPTPQQIVGFLDKGEVATVEGLRELLLEELRSYQADIEGGEFNTAEVYYEKGKPIGELAATLRIAERLRLRLEPRSITITPEHQLRHANRSDFTASKLIGGQRRLLVTEVKGQWHKDLFTAASSQLDARYAIHPNAEDQGIYLVLWFGGTEKVAHKKNIKFSSAAQLKAEIEDQMPGELRGRIDVFVLDLSRPN